MAFGVPAIPASATVENVDGGIELSLRVRIVHGPCGRGVPAGSGSVPSEP